MLRPTLGASVKANVQWQRNTKPVLERDKYVRVLSIAVTTLQHKLR